MIIEHWAFYICRCTDLCYANLVDEFVREKAGRYALYEKKPAGMLCRLFPGYRSQNQDTGLSCCAADVYAKPFPLMFYVLLFSSPEFPVS